MPSRGFAAADLGVTIAGVAVFLIVALTIGQRLVDRLLWAVATNAPTTTPAVVVVALVIGAGAITQWMGVEAVLGAFIAGLVIGRSRWRDERALQLVESIAHAVLAPLFFATAGLRMDLGVFADPLVARWSVIVIVVASLTKFLGAFVGATAGRLPRREGLALGAALNARGALEIVIASIGLGLGVLNDASYGVIVVMAIVTSLAAPPLLRTMLAGWSGTDEEQQRLAAEDAARSRVVVSDRPPLLLTRGHAPSVAAAQVIDLCWPAGEPVSLLASAPEDALAPIRQVFASRPVRVIDGDDDLRPDEVLQETNRGHSAIVVGMSDRPGEPVLSPFVGSILAAADRPVVLMRNERMSGGRLPAAFGRAVVPISGSVNSQAAQELAFGLSAAIGTQLALAYVDGEPALFSFETGSKGTGADLLEAAAERATLAGARPVVTFSRRAESVAAELGRIVIEYEADLVVVGTTPRASAAGARLGPVAMHLLEVCPATVVVVATPPGWTGHHGRA
ncbi:MAG: cation:proton antiporter [Acidimicrobiales bacterium]